MGGVEGPYIVLLPSPVRPGASPVRSGASLGVSAACFRDSGAGYVRPRGMEANKEGCGVWCTARGDSAVDRGHKALPL